MSMEPSNTGSVSLARRIKDHVRGRAHDFFAVVQPGFEQIAADELSFIGAGEITGTIEGGIEFRARLDGLYRAHLCSRTITRVLMRLTGFRTDSFERLNKKLSEFPWELYLAGGSRVSVHATSRHSRLYHTGRIAEEVQKAVTERLSGYGLDVFFPKKEEPFASAQTIHLRLEDDICRVSLDASGDPLYRRGLRTHVTDAPLRETLAALILRAACAERYDCIVDPMCGSGTFCLEAAMLFLRMYPGLHRDFAFTGWPSFREAAFNHMARALEAERLTATDKIILCSDIDPDALDAARANLEAAGLAEKILPERRDFLTERIALPEGKKSLLVLNPPYGSRLATGKNIAGFYRTLGARIREEYHHEGYAVIVPGIELEKALGLGHGRKILFMNGGIRVALIIQDAY